MKNTDNLNDFKRNFYEKYHKVLIPTLQGYEGNRKSKLFWTIFQTIALIAGGIGYFIFIITFKIDGRDVEGPGLLMLAAGCLSYWWAKKSFEAKLKSKIMHVVSSCFGDMFWSQSYSYSEALNFVNAGLFPSFTRMDVDDAFIGTYKNVKIDIAEADFIKGTGKNSHSIFKGLCIKLEMNKQFTGHTILMEDSLLHQSPLQNLRHTKLEDVNFEKKYDVFTNDEVEARYILTPTFMERLAGIRMAFRCKAIRCAFYQGQIFIAMKTTKDLFSIGSLVKPVTDTKQFQDLCDQFISVLNLIDYLKLDKKAVL